jgi:hypothetical protein
MKHLLRPLFLALVALAAPLASSLRADNMASIAILPATGAVTLLPHWATGPSLSGFHFMAQDLSLGGGANQFYSLKGTPIPVGGDVSAFTHYIAASGAPTAHADIGSKLKPNSYSALTSADPDLGYGSVNLYTIHHTVGAGDYLTAIIPSSGTASAVTDEKPMSGPGGTASGYFGLTFAAANLGYGLNSFYYLRDDAVTHTTKFGSLVPALAGASNDLFDLGTSGFNSLVFSGADVGFGVNKMYYLRLDPITGFTIFGTLDATSGKSADVANLGSVFSAMTFVPGDLTLGGGNQFYTTGAINTTWQSVSFAAIPNRTIGAGSFTVAPSASSGLPITLTVVPGSTGAASISGPVAGVYTVTPVAPGVITLQAAQAGANAPVAYEYNMLRQSFTVTGVAVLSITTQPTSQTAVAGATATFSVSASGLTTPTYQWRKAGANISGNASATTSTLSLPNVQTADVATYDVVVTNGSGSIVSNPVTLTLTTPAPVITNSPLTAGATVGTAFTYTITASGTPTSYSASPLPAGLTVNTATGVISGTPTTAANTTVLLGATNSAGTGNASLAITVGAAAAAPVITNSPLTAGGTVGSPFSFAITATGSPTSYSSGSLPAGLTLNTGTGVISGSPTAVGTTSVILGATNGTGTGNATLSITIAAAGVAPIITNSPLTAAGTVGTPFSFTIVASGSPTSYSAAPLPAGLTLSPTTGVISGTPSAAGVTSVLLGATNASGTGNATLSVTVSAAGVAPIITNSPLTAAATVGTPFSFSITASGSPNSYSAAGLPAGLSIVPATGVITGTPTAAGTSLVTLGATNSSGTGNATVTITVAPAGVAPVITNNPVIASGTVGSPFSFVVTASNSPIAYTASPLPPGLSIVPATGVITGIPTVAGTTAVLVQASNAYGVGTSSITITVSAPTVAPVIISAPAAAATVGVPFATYVIAASGSPNSFTATGLPPGLTLNTLTGAINGTPTGAGTYLATITAGNSAGTATSTLNFIVAPAGILPVIISPTNAPATAGQPFTYVIAATGQPVSYTATGLPPGLLLNILTGAITGIPTTAGTSVVTISSGNSAGTAFSTVTITVAAAGVAPVFTSATTASGTAGSVFPTYVTAATGLPTSFSATGLPAGLTINPITGAINGTPTTAGTYIVNIVATNATGTSSTNVTFTVAGGAVSRIVNFSARAVSGPGSQALVMGFVTTGDGKNLLIRGVGPTLKNYGVINVLPDPLLTIYGAAGTPIAMNDDWQLNVGVDGTSLGSNAAAIAAVSAQFGAFALPAGSKDAAMLLVVNSGVHTTGLVRPVSATGIALTEVYDIDSLANPGSRLLNVAARMNVGTGEAALSAGFVIAGNAPKTVLIRAVGPSLAAFGVAGVLADPQIVLFSGSSQIASDDNWESGSSSATLISTTSARVGAFPLPTGSKDAALLATLQPGVYTVQVTGVGNTTGVALVEVYETTP